MGGLQTRRGRSPAAGVTSVCAAHSGLRWHHFPVQRAPRGGVLVLGCIRPAAPLLLAHAAAPA